jgi:hypothetical protein
MPKIDYPQVIKEDPQELERLEKQHRYSHDPVERWFQEFRRELSNLSNRTFSRPSS